MPAINKWTPALDRAGVMRFNRGPLNVYDACLINEKIAWANFCTTTPPLPYCLRPQTKYVAPPWIAMPSEAKRFQRTGTLPVINPTSGVSNFTGLDIPLQFQGVSGPLFICDNGYDGIVTEISLGLVASGDTGFVEASGDVTWRVGVDYGQSPNSSLYYFRDYGNIQISQGINGDGLVPVQLYNNGLRFISNQALTIYVNLAVAAMARISPSATVIGVLGGWTWPR